jgi:hypothetical protein
VACVGFLFFFWYTRYYTSGIEVDFFSSSAQVIPVLILALTIDVVQDSSLKARELAPTLTIAFIGETNALAGAGFPVLDNRLNFSMVSASILALSVALILALGARGQASKDSKYEISKPIPSPATGADAQDLESAPKKSAVERPTAAVRAPVVVAVVLVAAGWLAVRRHRSR